MTNPKTGDKVIVARTQSGASARYAGTVGTVTGKFRSANGLFQITTDRMVFWGVPQSGRHELSMYASDLAPRI